MNEYNQIVSYTYWYSNCFEELQKRLLGVKNVSRGLDIQTLYHSIQIVAANEKGLSQGFDILWGMCEFCKLSMIATWPLVRAPTYILQPLLIDFCCDSSRSTLIASVTYVMDKHDDLKDGYVQGILLTSLLLELYSHHQQIGIVFHGPRDESRDPCFL